MKHLQDQSLEARAMRRVRRKMGFFIHAAVYLMVNGGLFLLNELAVPGHRFHHYPLMGWGLGLAIHGVVTLLSLQGDGLRRQMLAREMAALQRAEGR